MALVVVVKRRVVAVKKRSAVKSASVNAKTVNVVAAAVLANANVVKNANAVAVASVKENARNASVNV